MSRKERSTRSEVPKKKWFASIEDHGHYNTLPVDHLREHMRGMDPGRFMFTVQNDQVSLVVKSSTGNVVYHVTNDDLYSSYITCLVSGKEMHFTELEGLIDACVREGKTLRRNFKSERKACDEETENDYEDVKVDAYQDNSDDGNEDDEDDEDDDGNEDDDVEEYAEKYKCTNARRHSNPIPIPKEDQGLSYAADNREYENIRVSTTTKRRFR